MSLQTPRNDSTLTRGVIVTMQYDGRTLLGDVRDIRADGNLLVTHFNGEPWPLEPRPDQVERV